MVAVVEVDHRGHSGLVDGQGDCLGVLDAGGQGFLDEQVLARAGQFDADIPVVAVGRHDADGLDVLIVGDLGD